MLARVGALDVVGMNDESPVIERPLRPSESTTLAPIIGVRVSEWWSDRPHEGQMPLGVFARHRYHSQMSLPVPI